MFISIQAGNSLSKTPGGISSQTKYPHPARLLGSHRRAGSQVGKHAPNVDVLLLQPEHLLYLGGKRPSSCSSTFTHFRPHRQSGLQTRLHHQRAQMGEIFNQEQQPDLIAKAREVIRKDEATFTRIIRPGLDNIGAVSRCRGGVKV